MRRFELSDAHWERLALLLPPQKPRTGRPAEDHRQVLNGMLWILRTGPPLEDLPARYGAAGTVSSRFYRWRNVRSLEALHRCWMSEMGALLLGWFESPSTPKPRGQALKSQYFRPGSGHPRRPHRDT
uniref:transposase n=1 Tax=Methylobacterium sp. B34 TaxID=95563 RepID=UPI0023428B3E|nr:transposase [Methylobacterium sp. B34]